MCDVPQPVVSPKKALPKRLMQRREFLKVQNHGRRFRGRTVTLLVHQNDFEIPRIGLVASKKVGNAVVRNKTRRRAKEIFRLHQTLLCKRTDHVLIVSSRAAALDYQDLESEVLALLKKAAQAVS